MSKVLAPVNRRQPWALLGKPVLLGFAIIAGLSMARAGTTDGSFAIHGLGIARCDAVVTAIDGEQGAGVRTRLADWLTGYITGMNRVLPETFNLVPLRDNNYLVALLETACRANGGAQVETVLAAIINQFAPMQLRSASETLTLTAGEQSVQISTEALGLIQQILAARSLMAGPANPGVFDQATQDALFSYQKSMNLPQTGLPDDPTIISLLSSS